MVAASGKHPNDFSKLVVVRLKKDFLSRRKIVEYIRNQGFDLSWIKSIRLTSVEAS